MDYKKSITEHYIKVWNNTPFCRYWDKGPIHELPNDFCVLEFEPTNCRDMWTYATCGMSLPTDANPIELHIFTPERNDSIVELLTVVAHYHRTGSALNVGHTVNFGRAWWENSKCEYGLISLPYLDGPILEWSYFGSNKTQFLWLIPITSNEVEYKLHYGLDALEEKFEKINFNYVDPNRGSAV